MKTKTGTLMCSTQDRYIAPLCNSGLKFNVLLTVLHAMILGNCPTWCTNSF